MFNLTFTYGKAVTCSIVGGSATVGGAATVEAASHIAFDNFHINSFFCLDFKYLLMYFP